MSDQDIDIQAQLAAVDRGLELGGRYQVEGNAGGTITACTPGQHFAATWEFGGQSSDIEVTVAPDGDGARFTLVHTAVGEGYEAPDSFWNTYGPGATGVGWELGFLGLFQYLSTGTSMPAEASEWGTSAAAKEFITGSSVAWGDAGIAAGMDEQQARAAQDRTTAFYTGG